MNTEYPSEKAKNLVTQYGGTDRCKATMRGGNPCPLRAVKDGLCFSHSQLAQRMKYVPGMDAPNRVGQRPTCQAPMFAMTLGEISERIERLTVRQMTALEYLCDGETCQSMAAVLGVTYASVLVLLQKAMKRAGVRTRDELIALYAMWRVLKGGRIE